MHLFVDTQPSFLFIRGQQIHDLRKVIDDVLSDFFDEGTSFFRDLHQNLAPIVRGVRALDVPQILQAVHQTRRCGGGMVHFFRDFAHGKEVVSCNVSEQEKLRKRDLPSREFLGEAQHETTLQHHHDVCKSFDIRAYLRSLQLDHDRLLTILELRKRDRTCLSGLREGQGLKTRSPGEGVPFAISAMRKGGFFRALMRRFAVSF